MKVHLHTPILLLNKKLLNEDLCSSKIDLLRQ